MTGPGRCECHGRTLTRRLYTRTNGTVETYWYCPAKYDEQKAEYRATERGREVTRKWRLTAQCKYRAARILQIQEELG